MTKCAGLCRFHRECIRLCFMEEAGCPCTDCHYKYERMAGECDQDDYGGYGDHVHQEDEDEGCVSGITLAFICENERLWLRVALLIKYYSEVDNMARGCREMRVKEDTRDASMRKEREVVMCVDMPQLEEKGWNVSDAVAAMLVGVRDRDELIEGIDVDSSAVVDHILDTVNRDEREVRGDLKALRRVHREVCVNGQVCVCACVCLDVLVRLYSRIFHT